MENLNDSSKAPAEVPSNFKNSEAAKLRAIKYMLEELRMVSVHNDTKGSFGMILGFTEGTIDRMMQSNEGDEFSWLGYVTERIEKFKACFDTKPNQSISDLLDEMGKSPLSFGSKRMF